MEKDLQQIRKKITNYQELQDSKRKQLQHLNDESFQHKLRIYLSEHRLEDSNIEKVEEKLKVFAKP